MTGKVFLVGAGPGDPELLTRKAYRLLQCADVVVYDRLVSQEIMDLIPASVQRVYAGKQASNHSLPQPEINLLLVELARQFDNVIRLKGGDPFIFGRGGEELEVLHEAGIRFEVVPGISAAMGCGAYAGIPLTHRDHANACLLATGHLKDNTLDLDWPALVAEKRTLVFYMGVLSLPHISRNLIAHGLPESTPIALIRHGTTLRQDVRTGTLAVAEHLAEDLPPGDTGLIIIGDVVSLRPRLNWFQTQ